MKNGMNVKSNVQAGATSCAKYQSDYDFYVSEASRYASLGRTMMVTYYTNWANDTKTAAAGAGCTVS